MQSNEENIPNNGISNVNSKNYKFDFEEYSWNNNFANNCYMAKNVSETIEKERHAIEKDLKVLEAIELEKSKQKDLMISLMQLKEKLERKTQFKCE